MRVDGLEIIFFRWAPVSLLFEMDNEHGSCYISMLSKKANITYSHAVKLFEKMRKNGLVEFEKRGRIKQVTFTQKGKDVVNHLRKLIAAMNDKDGKNPAQ